MLLRKLAPDMTAAFDAAYRLTQRSNRSLSYDDNGNLVNDGTKIYTWDARNQLTALSTGASFSYDATGRRINGAQGAFYRSNAENLITRIDEFGWPIQHGDDEDRDEGDDRSDHEDGIGRVKHFTYRYDGANRVTDVIAKSGAYYDYDLADNLLSAKGRKIDFAAGYNNVNQIVEANSTNYQYDVNGNLLDDGKRQYVWDAENRLLSITDKTIPGKLTKFRYDGLSRRLAIIDQANSAATSIENRYLWCDRILCQERDAQDNVTKRYYSQGETQGATKLYYARDHLESVMEVINGRGNIEATNEYDAYGNTSSSSRNGVNSGFRYAGMFYHEPSKLYLTLYRAYDPSTARWLTRDPIEENGGINLYAYTGGNPINFSDPFGLAICSCKVAGGGGSRTDKGEKICTYSCTCKISGEPSGCSDKTITFEIKSSAGFSGSAECIGQTTIPFDYTQPGQIPSASFSEFYFDTNSTVEKFNPFSSVPNRFIEQIKQQPIK